MLQLIAVTGPAGQVELASAWRASRPGISERHAAELSKMTRHLLWRLSVLGWVIERDGKYELTRVGARLASGSYSSRSGAGAPC